MEQKTRTARFVQRFLERLLPPDRITRNCRHIREYEIVLDNGPELIRRVLHQWVAEHGIRIDFIEAGKSEQYARMETFNGRFRDECLISYRLTSLADTLQITET